MRLKEKVAIITGATSGMGRATAELFGAEGAKVVVVGRNEERAKKVVEGIKAKGGEAIYVLADSNKVEDNQKIFDETMKAYGTVDVLFNNAGMLSMTSILDLTEEEFDKMWNVNVKAALVLTQLVAPVMKEKGKGAIINTSSVAGLYGHHGFAAYVTTKHAMAGLTKSMAFELGPEIRANAIAPGAIHTGMVDSIGGPAVLTGMIEGSALKRIGEGKDIASVVLFLATDESSFITGQIIKVDGGFEV